MNLWWQQESIVDLLDQQSIDDALKQKLMLVQKIRDFSETELSLPVEDNYSSYVALPEPYVIWSVIATEEFSVEPKKWCYLIIGCASYRGYFAKQTANEYAALLRKQGYDVKVQGIIAYSTLGWFSDPVLSSFINMPDWYLAALIFHELAHKLLYVKNDTKFNESFATTVEQEGLKQWLAAINNSEQYTEYEIFTKRKKHILSLIARYKRNLKKLYEKNISTVEKRVQKQTVFTDALNEYEKLKNEWGGYNGFDGWFQKPLNNAQFAIIGDYHDLVPSFSQILHDNNYDFVKFYESVAQISKMDKKNRDAYLAEKNIEYEELAKQKGTR